MDKDMDQAKGKLKQAAGDLTGNDKLKHDGKTDQRAGKAKEAVAKTKDKVDGAVNAVKDKLHKN